MKVHVLNEYVCYTLVWNDVYVELSFCLLILKNYNFEYRIGLEHVIDRGMFMKLTFLKHMTRKVNIAATNVQCLETIQNVGTSYIF